MTVETTTTTSQATPAGAEPRSRRQVLCGLMVALVAPGALIAACGTETDSGSTVDNPNTGTPGSGGSAPTGGSAGGSALAALADIPDGGGVLADGPDGKVLLVRTGSEVKGYDPACPHQGATVDPPKSGVITCPRHGSTFSGTDGAVTKGPANSGLKTIAVKVEGDSVVLA